MKLIPTSKEIENKRRIKREISAWLTEQMNNLSCKYGTSDNLEQFEYFKQVVRQQVMICLDAITHGLTEIQKDIGEKFHVKTDPKKNPLFKFYIKGGNAFKYSLNPGFAAVNAGTSDWDTQLLVNPWLSGPITEEIYQQVENLIAATFEQTALNISYAFGPLTLPSTEDTTEASSSEASVEVPGLGGDDDDATESEDSESKPTDKKAETRKNKTLADYINTILQNIEHPEESSSEDDKVPQWRDDYPTLELVDGKITQQFSHSATGLWENTSEKLKGSNAPSIVESDRIAPFKIFRLGWLWQAHYAPTKTESGASAADAEVEPPEIVKSILMELIDITIPRRQTIEAITQWHEFVELAESSSEGTLRPAIQEEPAFNYTTEAGMVNYLKPFVESNVATIKNNLEAPKISKSKLETSITLAKNTVEAIKVMSNGRKTDIDIVKTLVAISQSSVAAMEKNKESIASALKNSDIGSLKQDVPTITLIFPNIAYHAHEQLIMLCEIADGTSEHADKIYKRFARFAQCRALMESKISGSSVKLLKQVNGGEPDKLDLGDLSNIQKAIISKLKETGVLEEGKVITESIDKIPTKDSNKQLGIGTPKVIKASDVQSVLELMVNVSQRTKSLAKLNKMSEPTGRAKTAQDQLIANFANNKPGTEEARDFINKVASKRKISNKGEPVQALSVLSAAYSTDSVLKFVLSETGILNYEEIKSAGIRNMFFCRVGNEASLAEALRVFVNESDYKGQNKTYPPISISHNTFHDSRFTKFGTCLAYDKNGKIQDCLTFITANKTEAPFYQFESPELSYKFYADLRLMAQQRKAIAALTIDYVIHTALSQQVQAIRNLIGDI